MEEKMLTCISCPLGCQLTVSMENGQVVNVSGNTCPRGDVYGRKEVTAPTRIVTSSVRVHGGDCPMVSVKTKEDIPKEKIRDICQAMRGLELQAPIAIGDIIVPNICDTGVDLIATRQIRSLS